MYNLKDIKEVHLEVTSKCQARCPMCPRRISGGMLNPLITLDEITLEQFQQWFPVSFVKQLDRLFMCGNLGDPIIAEDTLEIFKYLRENNPKIHLSMHTNGSARTKKWWHDLAYLNVYVTFGIDGLEDTHHLYRVATDWPKIIENAKTFIDNGGWAEWHMLVFKHNEHQIEDCKSIANKMNFSKFTVKHTSRFKNDRWPVLDDLGKPTHYLEPTEKSQGMISMVQEAIQADAPTIFCKAKHQSQIYVAATGIVSPCCWLDYGWILPSQDSRVDYMERIGTFPSLHNASLNEIFESGYFETIENTWLDKPLQECSKQCGIFDKLGAQFEN
jgi:MoaA/NifB/PqqE/SkfB family radical SAM enzyme